MAFYIFIYEIKQNHEFSVWFKDNSKLVAAITIFGSGNVELLNLLNSRFAGFNLFFAPFSTKSISLIFWGKVMNIIIEDLPQLIIQVNIKLKR